MHPSAHTAQPTMTNEEFEAWSLDSEYRWELMGGIPVQMQAEGRPHSRTSRKIVTMLEDRLSGHPCTPDERVDVICGSGEIRNPDVLIDCAPEAATSRSSRAFLPIVVFEVAVTSQAYDLGGKHLVYFQNPHVQHYVAVLPLERQAMHVMRGGTPRLLAPEDSIVLEPQPGLTVLVADLLEPSGI